MSTGSNIEWTEATWNPVVGCTAVSPGCLNCYAATMTNRLGAMGQKAYVGLTVSKGRGAGNRSVFNGTVRCLPDKLTIPLKRRKPTVYFVNSMSDLFHEAVPDQFIRLVFAVMSYAGQHTFQILTKRPERMAAWFANPENDLSSCQAEWCVSGIEDRTPTGKHRIGRRGSEGSINGTRKGLGDGNYWPLPSVWLGTSTENQAMADERIPHLLKCPAVVRFLSVEPQIGPVSITPAMYGGTDFAGIQWVIQGGESGPHARPFRAEWARTMRNQCAVAGVAYFLKQLGSAPVDDHPALWPNGTRFATAPRAKDRVWDTTGLVKLKNNKGGDPSEWPEDLRVREMPRLAQEARK